MQAAAGYDKIAMRPPTDENARRVEAPPMGIEFALDGGVLKVSEMRQNEWAEWGGGRTKNAYKSDLELAMERWTNTLDQRAAS